MWAFVSWTAAAGLVMLSTFGSAAAASAVPKSFGPFTIDPSRPNIITMEGEIGRGSALDFRRALAAAPEAGLLVLNSPGGLVDMSLLIADDVHQRKLSTLIPSGSQCFSACAYIFLAGKERLADGQLGVHQISSDAPDLESAQLSISDIIDTLNRFETPVDVLTVMFRTPSSDMHVFTADEVASYKINRKAGDPTVAAVNPDRATPSVVTISPEAPSSTSLSEPEVVSAPVATPLGTEARTKLSMIEDYTRQPTRMALYPGLDFFGTDIASESVADAGACAGKCFEAGGACMAFTFNMKTRAGRGPNCFLKSGRGRMDGNSQAISGQLLGRAESNPTSFTMGVIDPVTNLYKDVDVPGFDLSRRAHRSAKTQLDCRLACVNDDRCVAFTFVKQKKECWLKDGVGNARAMIGAVSGTKKITTFTPTIIDLQ